MTPRIEALKQYFVLDKAHHAVRVPAPGAEGAPYRDAALPAHRRSALRLKAALEAETPVIFPEERIVATRTLSPYSPFCRRARWAISPSCRMRS